MSKANGRPTQTRRGGRNNPRRVAFDTLRAVSADDAYANLVLPKALAAANLSERDSRLATELAYGTLRAQGTLDAVLTAASGRDLTDLRPDLVDALRLGAYQILWTRIDAYAAVSTTVGLVKGAVAPKVSGLANAVLRKVADRSFEQWRAELMDTPRASSGLDPTTTRGRLAFDQSHPEWIVAEFESLLPESEVEAALAENNSAPQVHLTARPGRITRSDLASQTGGEVGRWSPYAVYLSAGDPGRVPAVAAKAAGVQDEGSQAVTLALTDTAIEGSDAAWVDLCAGPGGKSALLGSLARERSARVTAVEPAAHRADLVRENTTDMPVEVVEADGRRWGRADGADRVLVDAPCSGLGALRRRPEARWRKQPVDVAELSRLQRALLHNAVRITRRGGVVAYVTCSPLWAETKDIVDSVVAEGHVEVVESPALVSEIPDTTAGPYRQLWPHRHGTDAMFLALLRRV
nr:transcription antitermination factor NusB [Haloglycomyces albus]